MKKIAFICHGKLKNLVSVENEVNTVFNSGYDYKFLITRHCDHGIELAQQSVANGAEYVICIGGDGSLNEVANGIMNSGSENVKMGVLPKGTGNDFARGLGITFDIEALKKMIEVDTYRNIDLGLAQFINPKGQQSSRYYINITDIGIGGFIAQNLVNASKAFGPTITYQKALIKGLIKYRKQAIKVISDTFSYEGRILSLIIANGKFFGGGMGIAPDAVPDDGQFQVVMAGEISLWDYLLNSGKVMRSERIIHPALQYHLTAQIAIAAINEPLPIDMDGEFIGYSPLKIKVVPAAIKFLAPL